VFELLSGVRVIESALLLNGDACGMLFADLGADVIKVEDPVRGDYIRDILGQITPRHSPAHLQVNKGKRSLTLDLKSERGRELFWQLLATADVFVDGLKAGASDKLGIGYEAQVRIKPDIIYVSYTGYGAAGPYARIPTHGFQMNALAGGLPSKMVDGRLERARGVQYMGGVEVAGNGPAMGALYAALAAVSALARRNHTGEGAFIDTAASDAVLASAWFNYGYAINYDRITDFIGMTSLRGETNSDWPEGSVRYQLYRTKDEKALLFCLLEPKFWVAFCQAVGRDDLSDTIRPDRPIDFGHDKPWLREELQSIIETRTLGEWTSLASELGVPMGPAPQLEEVAGDPHNSYRGVVQEADIPGVGAFTYTGFPALVNGSRNSLPSPAPEHGEHTDAVLLELGVDQGELIALRTAGIIK
jgi:crotonobetainyl-CoA:carnitine CoA-transferase CaiB-like acyl-CoA transferase